MAPAEVQVARADAGDSERAREVPNPRIIRDSQATIFSLILAAIFFVVDLNVPLGIAGGVPYVAVLLLSLWHPRRERIWIAATGCSALIVIGFFVSPPGAGTLPALSNRALALFAIWSIAAVGNRHRRAETMFRLAVMGAPQAILVVDDRGDIKLANPRVKEMFGYEPDELIGGTVDQLVPRSLRAQHVEHRADFVREPDVRSMGAGRDLHAVHQDGAHVPVEIGLTPLEADRARLTLCTIIDITERKRAEAMLAQQRDDLETLLHVISHDLKEPLRAIISFSRMTEARSADVLDPKSRDFLRRVVRASERLQRLLDDVLALSQARKLSPASHRDVDAGALVDDALERLAERVAATQATVNVIAPLPVLNADRTWAAEAVYNLLSNALKFYGGTRHPDIEIAAYEPPDGSTGEIGIVVRDRGPGVDPENAERIFTLFQRAHGRKVEGTGAGLAIVRTVAERHGGRAWVRERAGGGSEFVITFAVDQ